MKKFWQHNMKRPLYSDLFFTVWIGWTLWNSIYDNFFDPVWKEFRSGFSTFAIIVLSLCFIFYLVIICIKGFRKFRNRGEVNV